MKKNSNVVELLRNNNKKVVELTKYNYTLDNGDVFEHTFEIPENITIEKFQVLLNNAKNNMIKILNNIDEI